MSQPTHAHLRALAAAGGLLVLAGALLGWFERSDAADVAGPVVDVRPGDVLGVGPLGWLVLVPFLVAPLLRGERRARLLALVSVVPGLVLVVLAAALPPRTAVAGETIGEVVVSRTSGQALSLVGALIATMALTAAWRGAPDWRIPFEWSRTAPEP